MKNFIKILFIGLQVVMISALAILCFVAEFPLCKNFLSSMGFAAVMWFIAMVVVLALALMCVIFLGFMGRVFLKHNR